MYYFIIYWIITHITCCDWKLNKNICICACIFQLNIGIWWNWLFRGIMLLLITFLFQSNQRKWRWKIHPFLGAIDRKKPLLCDLRTQLNFVTVFLWFVLHRCTLWRMSHAILELWVISALMPRFYDPVAIFPCALYWKDKILILLRCVVIARRHFIFPINSAQPRDDHPVFRPLSLSSFSLFHVALGL